MASLRGIPWNFKVSRLGTIKILKGHLAPPQPRPEGTKGIRILARGWLRSLAAGKVGLRRVHDRRRESPDPIFLNLRAGASTMKLALRGQWRKRHKPVETPGKALGEASGRGPGRGDFQLLPRPRAHLRKLKIPLFRSASAQQARGCGQLEKEVGGTPCPTCPENRKNVPEKSLKYHGPPES